MLPILAGISTGVQLVKLVPSLFKLFGDDPPPAIITRAAEIAQSVTGALNPEEALKQLKENAELNAKFVDAAEARAADMVKVYLADMQDARKRDTEIQRIKGSNKRADVLAAMAIVAVILCLVVVSWLSHLDDFAKATITLICGRALGWVEQVFSFEFGTTKSSKVKDDTISSLSKDHD
jgi:hypothetical protein